MEAVAMLGTDAYPAKSPELVFQLPPWSEDDPAWQELDREVPADSPARLIVARLDRVDLTPLLRRYRGSGSKAFHPLLLLRIILIEIERGHCLPAEWWRNCQDSRLLLWAGRGIRPSRATWYNFPNRIGPLLEQLVRQTITQGVKEQVTSATAASLDGTFFAANASRHRLVNKARAEERVALLRQACAADQNRAAETLPAEVSPESTGPAVDSVDHQDANTRGGERPSVAEVGQKTPPPQAWMAKTPATRLRQLERYERCCERLDALQAVNLRQRGKNRRPVDKIVVSPTDPEAVVGRDKLKVYRPLFNAQVVRDLDSPLLLGYETRAANHDGGALKTMLRRLPEVFEVTLHKLAADASYLTGSNLAICEAQHIDLYGPLIESHEVRTKRGTRPGKRAAQLPKSRFEWLPEQNAYRCPENFLLIHIGQETSVQADGETSTTHKYRCPPLHCRACPQAANCTTNPLRGRTIRRQQHEELLERHRQKMTTDDARQFSRRRSQTVETTFADFKANRSLRNLSFRGTHRADIQLGLLVLVNNLLCLAKRELQRQTAGVSPGLPRPAS
jgi:transposase